MSGRWPSLLLLLGLATPLGAIAGAWTQAPGGGYAKAWVRWQAGIGPFADYYTSDAEGRRVKHDLGGYHEVHVAGYVEVGLVERVTLVVHWPVIASYHMTGVNLYSHLGTADPTVAVRWGLLQRRFVLSVQTGATMPLAASHVYVPVRDVGGGGEFGQLRVGTGVWDLIGLLQAGWTWPGGHLGAEAGARYRTHGFHPVVVTGAEAGVEVSNRVELTARVGWVGAVGRSSAPIDESPNGIGNGTRYLYYTGEVDVSVNELLSVGSVLEGACCYRRQAGGPVLNLYIARQW